MTEVRWSTILTDLLTLGSGGIILLVFATSVTPRKRGFYCDDETIQYPFHASTIPNYALYIFTFTIPVLTICVTEFISHRRTRSSGIFLFRPMPLWFIYMYRSIVDFLFGCAASQLVTDIGKYSIGRLRPNFISVCGPSVDFSDCSKYNHSYITNYVCTNALDDDAKESRVSFPSGHSSFSAYTMLYIAIYIQVRWHVHRRTNLRLLKSGVQLALLLLAYFTALSRVMDNKHHWSDVLAGGIVGTVAASLTARFVSKLVKGSDFTSPSNEKIAREMTDPAVQVTNSVPSMHDVESGIRRNPLPPSSTTRQQSQSVINNPQRSN